jgi:HEAT repeat protein
LNYQVAPLKQGRYRIQGRFNSDYPDAGLHAESPARSFEILDTPRSRVRQRVAELVRDVNSNPRRVAPLLGFAGDTAAIAPLVDLLYRQDDGVQASAVDALLFLDRAEVTNALLDALKQRGARYRLVEFLVLTLQAPAAEMRPSLLQSLADSNPDARAAAVDGLRLSNTANDPTLFAPLAGMLTDSVAKVRHSASTAVGGYENEAALKALKTVVADTDPDVSEQATICVGWIAESASRDGETRKEAVDLLRSVAVSSRGRASQQAKSWLARIGSH